MQKLTVYHIPVCPFCQRLEILLELKGLRDAVQFKVIDITAPRPDWLLAKTRGSTSLPVLQTEDGRILKESLVILRYLEDRFPDPPIAQHDAYRRAVEGMMCAMDGELTGAGYRFVMNQDRARRGALRDATLAAFSKLDAFLLEHNPEGTFLFDELGLVEAVFTPIMMRLWFLEYYEDFSLPDEPGFQRVRRWREACFAHPATQQTSKEQVVKMYYDYAKSAGNGALLPGRLVSSFTLDPSWESRPWPPRDKYGYSATDAELGLIRS